MDELEEQFLHELIAHRMEIHYKRICEAKPFSQRKQELEYYDNLEKKYQKILESLSEEDQTILIEYVDHISDRASDETENYYRCGFKDGLKLMGALGKYYIK